MATQTPYFVLGTPGTLGVFVAHLVSKFIDTNSSYPAVINKYEYATEPPTVVDPDFFYDNLVINDSLPRVFSVGMKPEITKLRTRFPGSRIIVITHTLEEIPFIAEFLYRNYYSDFNAGSEPSFREIISNHSWLFPNTDIVPANFTRKDEKIFKKILEYHKLLDGYGSTNFEETDYLVKISLTDIIYRPNTALSKLSAITRIDVTTEIQNFFVDNMRRLLFPVISNLNGEFFQNYQFTSA
jgi:hypothetical protein